MSIRNKIICALFMCAFVIYSFRTVSVDVSTANPATKTATWLSYLDPREWSWMQRAAVLTGGLGLAGLYAYWQRQRAAEADEGAAIKVNIEKIMVNVNELNMFMIDNRVIQARKLVGDERKVYETVMEGLDKLERQLKSNPSIDDLRNLEQHAKTIEKSFISFFKIEVISAINKMKGELVVDEMTSLEELKKIYYVATIYDALKRGGEDYIIMFDPITAAFNQIKSQKDAHKPIDIQPLVIASRAAKQRIIDDLMLLVDQDRESTRNRLRDRSLGDLVADHAIKRDKIAEIAKAQNLERIKSGLQQRKKRNIGSL